MSLRRRPAPEARDVRPARLREFDGRVPPEPAERCVVGRVEQPIACWHLRGPREGRCPQSAAPPHLGERARRPDANEPEMEGRQRQRSPQRRIDSKCASVPSLQLRAAPSAGVGLKNPSTAWRSRSGTSDARLLGRLRWSSAHPERMCIATTELAWPSRSRYGCRYGMNESRGRIIALRMQLATRCSVFGLPCCKKS